MPEKLGALPLLIASVPVASRDGHTVPSGTRNGNKTTGTPVIFRRVEVILTIPSPRRVAYCRILDITMRVFRTRRTV